jgi:hypothetical protein
MSLSALTNTSDKEATKARPILGLVCGEGNLPAILAESATARGYAVVSLALSPEAADTVRPYSAKVIEIYPGQMGKNIKIAHENGIREVVMVGRVPKLNILKNVTKLDWVAIKEISKFTNFSDHTMQQGVGDLMERNGIRVLPQAQFLRHLFPEVGVLTSRQPSAEEYGDIEYGTQIAKEIARLDIGQSVVVHNRIILAVEGAEGTDKCIRRGVEIARKPPVVVKVAKQGHDPRFDTPAVGLDTLKALRGEKPGGVLALGAGETMLIDREDCIRFAEANGISIVAF